MDTASLQAACRELFGHEPEPDLVDEIRRATNGNYALRNEGFAAQVTASDFPTPVHFRAFWQVDRSTQRNRRIIGQSS